MNLKDKLKNAPKLRRHTDRKPVDDAAKTRYDNYRAELSPNAEAADIDARALTKADLPDWSAKKSPDAIAVILDWLCRGYTKARACAEGNVSVRQFQRWKADDAEFCAAVATAIDIGTDLLEDEARRRAYDGIDRPVFQQGECVGHVREYSDPLMLAILGGRRPEKFARHKVEVGGPNGEAINMKIEVEFVSPEDVKK